MFSKEKTKQKQTSQKTLSLSLQQLPSVSALYPAPSAHKPSSPVIIWAAYIPNIIVGENWGAHVNIFFLIHLLLNWNADRFYNPCIRKDFLHCLTKLEKMSTFPINVGFFFPLRQYFRWIPDLKRME